MYLEFGKWLPPRLCACLLIHWTNEYDTRLAELRNAFYVPREAHFPVVQHTGRGVDAGTFHSALHWCILWSSPQLKHCIQFALPLYKDKTVTESPKEDYKDGEGSRGQGVWRVAKSLCLFSSDETKENWGGLQLLAGSGGTALNSALWWQQQDPRKQHGAASGKGGEGDQMRGYK